MGQGDVAREWLLKVMVGEEVGGAMIVALQQFGLVKHKITENKYELTQKGLDRLNGIQK